MVGSLGQRNSLHLNLPAWGRQSSVCANAGTRCLKDRTAISWLAVIGFILFLAATACGDAGPGAPGDGVWLLESLDGQPIFEESTITLRITGNQLDGFGGCNRYGGAFDVETPVAGADGDFSIPPFLVTEKWCGFVDRADSDVIVDQEDAYISALTQGERYRVAGGRLEILDGEGATRLVFVRKTSLPRQSVDLRGTSWRLITDDDVDNIERVTTLNFNGQQVSGSSGMRRLSWLV